MNRGHITVLWDLGAAEEHFDLVSVKHFRTVSIQLVLKQKICCFTSIPFSFYICIQIEL